MKLKHILEHIHEEQYIEVYHIAECVFAGHKGNLTNDNYLYMYVDKLWTTKRDMFGIEIR